MKTAFILFVAVHLLIDLAMPSLPGAFRFNPDESVVGIRVQPVQAQDLASAPEVKSFWMTVDSLWAASTVTGDPRPDSR